MSRAKVHNVLFLLLASARLIAAQPQDTTRAPELPSGPIQRTAMTACMECHDSSIIVQQRLSRAAWTKELDKMINWGALVKAKDRDALIEYFSVNFGPDEPPYLAPLTSGGRTPAKHRQN